MRALARGGGGVARMLAQCITEGWAQASEVPRRARVSEAANRKGGSGARRYSNSECAGLSPPEHACVLYYTRAISVPVRYGPHIRTISAR